MVDITDVPIDVCKAQNAARMPEYERAPKCVNRKEEKKMNRTECEEAVNDVCEMCFKKHELEYGHQPVNCAFRAFDNEDCPMITTLKKLIQEHFD